MLGELYNTRIFDIKNYFVPQSQYQAYSKVEKTKMILRNRIDKTFFIYEPDDFFYYWNLTLSKNLNKSINLKMKSLS